MVNGKQHICPSDQRRFATRAALDQHRRDAHPATPRVAAGPAKRRTPRNTRPSRVAGAGTSGSRVVSGTDIVSVSTTVTIDDPAGKLLARFAMSPAHFAGTRLNAEAGLWARWRPKSLSLQVVSGAGAMTSGMYLVAYSKDLDVVVDGTISGVQKCAAMVPSRMHNIHESTSFPLPCDTLQKWYLCTSREESDTIHGIVFVLLAAPLGNITAQSKINMIMKLNWTVEFSGPTLPGSVVEESVYVDPGYEGYHTTSDSSINSKLLILKHVAGGSACPFSQAMPDVVYRIDSQANLPYITENGKTAKVEFAVCAKTAPYKTFFLFASQDEAEKYISSGSEAHCLHYFGAGATVQPDNPAWRPAVASLAEENAKLRAQLDQLRRRQAPSQVATFDATTCKRVKELVEAVTGEGGSTTDWSKLLESVQAIAAVVTGGPLAESGAEAPHMRVSLEAVHLQDPREFAGTARFTRAVPVVHVDCASTSNTQSNAVRVYPIRKVGPGDEDVVEVLAEAVDQSE